jgi:hypothetical protein
MKTIIFLLVIFGLPAAAGAQTIYNSTSVQTESRVDTRQTGEGDPDQPVVTGEVKANSTTEQAGIEPDEIDVSLTGDSEQAAAGGYIKIGDIKGESTDDTEEKKGNVEYEWKVEEGESAVAGEGEIMIMGATVRGWDEAQKAAIRSQVKSAVNVSTRADLEVFAQAIALQNEAISEIEVEADEVAVSRVRTGKLFGFIPVEAQERIAVSTELDSLGRVKIKLPWWRFLAKLDEASAAQAGIEQALEAAIGGIEIGAQVSTGAQADTVPTENVSLNFEEVKAKILLAIAASVSL